jgi:hypothetical protein
MELLHKEELAYEAQLRENESISTRDAMQCPRLEQESDANSVATEKVKNLSSHGRSVSFRDGMEQTTFPSGATGPRTPSITTSPEGHAVSHPHSLEVAVPSTGFLPTTPPVSAEPRFRNLSPPPPPGSRFMGRGILRSRDSTTHGQSSNTSNNGVSNRTSFHRGMATPPTPARIALRPPHPLSVISSSYHSVLPNNELKGRYVPHVVTVSLDTAPIPEEVKDAWISRGKPPGAVARGYRPRLGQLLEAYPLDATKASAVTCVKFSPSADFCLIGYGVREPVVVGGGNFHPVTAVYRVRGGMDHVSTMLSGDDDVNIARFHPDSGHSFVYGTKQGRVRVLSPRPWNFYGNC